MMFAIRQCPAAYGSSWSVISLLDGEQCVVAIPTEADAIRYRDNWQRIYEVAKTMDEALAERVLRGDPWSVLAELKERIGQ